MPFAVVGSTDEIVVGGHKVRARQYPWGTVEGRLSTLSNHLAQVCVFTACCVYVSVYSM